MLRQTFPDFELIIVDDGSTDGTEQDYAAHPDERVRYEKLDRNRGNAAARNVGVRAGRGACVAFLDSDDEYDPDFLQRTVAALSCAPENVGFSWCGIRRVRSKAVVTAGVWNPRYPDRQSAYLGFLLNRSIGTCGLAVRRGCFEEVGLFDEQLRRAVDTDFLIRLARSFDFVVVPEVLVSVHLHGSQRVADNFLWGAEAYDRIIAKHRGVLEAHPGLYSRMLYKAGWQYYRARERRRGRSRMLRAIAQDKSNMRAWLGIGVYELFGARGAVAHATAEGALKRVKFGRYPPR